MRSSRVARCLLAVAPVALSLSFGAPARALDKQGSGAHGGAIDGAESGFDISGAVSSGLSIWNPTYAARPDNSGLTLMRYALHADIDLIGRRLSIPLDISMFSDREAHGAIRKFTPSELDVITGVTTTWRVGPGALELGSRIEIDRPLDRGGYDPKPDEGGLAKPPGAPPPLPIPAQSQTYTDVRARYLYSVATVAPNVGRALAEGDISGWLTLGWFAWNPSSNGTYFARPDNTGRALLRYAAHTELSILQDHISFGLDATMFTDSRADNVVRPTELDFTPEIIGRYAPWELHVAYERDMPVDRGGLVQHFVYVLAAYAFDLRHEDTQPLETRGHIVSP